MKPLAVKVVLPIILIFLFTYASAQQNQSESRDAEFYCNRGNAYLDKGQHQRAILDYTRALEINPRYADAYVNQGNAHAERGIAGGITEAYYRAIPSEILRQVKRRTSKALWKKAMEFSREFGIKEIVEQLDSLDAE